MRFLQGFTPFASALALVALGSEASGQQLPDTLGFSIAGSFLNGTAQSSRSILLADNDLTNGYASGFDLADAPAALTTGGPAGSAAFQWGEAAEWSDYPHTSAMWFQPLSGSNVAPEQSFELGYLFYRNGTIKSNTGATAVDIGLQIAFAQQLGISAVSEVFGTLLINTPNNNDDPVASADIVTLDDQVRELQFQDQNGNPYYLELTFQVDQDTMDNSLSTINEFRVFEGSQGRATMLGRFTTNPLGPQGDFLIPEPSNALMGLLGAALLLRRRR